MSVKLGKGVYDCLNESVALSAEIFARTVADRSATSYAIVL